MFQNGQIHFKNLAVFAARFLKCAWPFWDIMHQRAKFALYNSKREDVCNEFQNFMIVNLLKYVLFIFFLIF